MTYEEMMRVIFEVCPVASFGEDETGQIVIYTGLMDAGDGALKEHEL